jgi:predicted Holliday junction resolvase-like endonuclease
MIYIIAVLITILLAAGIFLACQKMSIITLQGVCDTLNSKLGYLENEKKALQSGIKANVEELRSTNEKLKTEIFRNKSVEVRTGQIMEKIVPFLEVFKHDPGRVIFCGQPIDYVAFSDDEIVFIEIKTGKSKTTKKQNNIRSLIEQGKVRFELIRLE